jgi:hypothetical protein
MRITFLSSSIKFHNMQELFYFSFSGDKGSFYLEFLQAQTDEKHCRLEMYLCLVMQKTINYDDKNCIFQNHDTNNFPLPGCVPRANRIASI